MPLQQITSTPVALNAMNSPSPTGWADPITNFPYFAGGLNQGNYFDLTDSEALALSDTAVGTLYEGRYRLVQLDAGATAANVKLGTIGLMKSAAGGVNLVTSYDQALAGGLRPVVFLCSVTPGNFCFVQELGTATILYKTGLTNVSPAVGDLVIAAASGLVDDPTQTTTLTYALLKAIIGEAIDLPTSNTTGRVLLDIPVVQG